VLAALNGSVHPELQLPTDHQILGVLASCSPVDVVGPHFFEGHLARLKPQRLHLVRPHRLALKRRHPEHCAVVTDSMACGSRSRDLSPWPRNVGRPQHSGTGTWQKTGPGPDAGGSTAAVEQAGSACARCSSSSSSMQCGGSLPLTVDLPWLRLVIKVEVQQAAVLHGSSSDPCLLQQLR